MTRPIGTGPAGGGGGAGVTSFAGRTGAVVPQAGDYTAADVGALPLSGGAMAGNIDMGGNNLLNAGAVASTGAVSGGSMTAGTFNGVPLTTAGSADDSLRGDGTYAAAPVFGDQYYQSPADTTPTAVSGFAFVPVYPAAASPVLPAGTYRLLWRSSLRSSSASAFATGNEARLLVDLADGAGLLQREEIVSYRPASSGVGVGTVQWQIWTFTLVAPVAITVQIEARETGTGTRTNLRSQWELWRVS